ncbi:hypothetical protein AA0119_g13330 [Alternaria tenuissima]|uniref:Secreted protein n=1 Tax=Alternaria tenuissima TaxID=119927 RepID=A0ABY0FNX0_9PLEO|nr:hypothetical protein AA0119_g13330 [Alternaria tenuissima]RYO04012.1 hypothetical protein AA0121_g12896 [Alternaria tenuissima]RYO47912.1 hypothetical protein AA0116_g12858 [Alternaria tenuissima]
MVRALLGFSRSVEGHHHHHHHHHHQDEETVLTFLVLAIQGCCQAGCKTLHAKSYGTIRQSTGSPHANKAASMAFYLTTLGDGEEGQA